MMTFLELKIQLSLELGREVPKSTLWRWLQDTGIGTKEEYNHSDLHVLAVFAGFLSRKRSVNFAQRKLNIYLKNDYQENPIGFDEAIPVKATAA